jgi:predicted deacylase
VVNSPDTALSMPVVVIRGSREGPTVSVVAGVHGAEYPPMLAAQQLTALVDPATLRGTLRMVLMASPNAFFARSVYYVPSDGRNLNRVFPGRADGSEADRLAHTIMTRVLTGADVVMDLHAGDANEALEPYIAAILTGDSARDHRTMQLAFASGFPQIIRARRSATLPPPGTPTSLTNAAATLRIPVLATESGELGRTDHVSVQRHVDAVLNTLRALDMVPQAARATRRAGTTVTVIESTMSAAATADGFWTPVVRAGDRVKRGQLLGRIVDRYGRELAELLAPAESRIIYLTVTPPVRRGESIASFAVRERRLRVADRR